jgi:sirohydrochlorin ferrochelatase
VSFAVTAHASLPLTAFGLTPNEIGIVIVDHGSRRNESNHMLEQVVDLFRQQTSLPIVEAAHMELAEPSISTAFRRVVEQGASLVVGHPYFLAPGRHWRQDIPALFDEAAKAYPNVRYIVTAPLGIHPLMQQIMQDRIAECLSHVSQRAGPGCNVCRDSDDGCELLPPKIS